MSLRKIAPLWVIPKLLAAVAVASNAPLATNGLASNQSRNFVMNMASLSPVPEPDTLAAQVKPVMENTTNVAATKVMNGKTAVVRNKFLTALKVICTTVMGTL